MDTAIAMSMLTFFTIFYMISVPYICILGGIDDRVCGAWIGGSVDETGKVVASLEILDSREATDVGVVIKVSQNILIAFVCLALAVIYDDVRRYEKRRRRRLLSGGSKSYKTLSSTKPGRDEEEEEGPENKLAFLWKKFPKFVIGYLLLSVLVSLVIIPVAGSEYKDRFLNNIGQFSKWLCTLGFVGIGAKTKFTTLWEAIKDGKYLKLYLAGQTMDTLITFIMAFVVYTYIA